MNTTLGLPVKSTVACLFSSRLSTTAWASSAATGVKGKGPPAASPAAHTAGLEVLRKVLSSLSADKKHKRPFR